MQVLRDGSLPEPLALPAAAEGVLKSTLALYQRAGYVPPWTGYLASEGEECVGACAFTAPPHEGRVEIAYYTFPEHRGRGIAAQMARALLDIAASADRRLLVVAHTLPQHGASTHILEKLGFAHVGAWKDPDAGLVWVWHRL